MQTKISFFLHVTATLHRELINWDAFQATSFGTLDQKFLYLRGFRVGNSLNVQSLIRRVGGISLVGPGLYDILEFAN